MTTNKLYFFFMCLLDLSKVRQFFLDKILDTAMFRAHLFLNALR
jgi:hypothetical protein